MRAPCVFIFPRQSLRVFWQADLPSAMPFIFFPVVVHAMDIVVSSVGIMFVTAAAHSATNPMDQLTRGYRCVCVAPTDAKLT